MDNITAFIWLNNTGAWIEIEKGKPVALFQHAHDFSNRIRLADNTFNEYKWSQGLDEFLALYRTLC
jgi:hypothetical protein